MCMSPLELFYSFKEQKYVFSYNPAHCSLTNTVIVPCGKCPECRKKWRTQLAQRVRYELSKYSYNEICFLTLTVSNEHMDDVFPDGSLNHSYFQKFMKRLRRRLEYHGYTKKIKYLCAGEYGEKTGRPHFHVILFGWKPDDLKYFYRSKKGYACYKSKMLEEVWGAGFVDVGDVDEHTAPYMVKYITKFSEVKTDEFKVNGKVVRKPYIVYPKKILGLDFFLENYQQILTNGYILDSRGQKVGIPRSFLKHAENSDDLLMQELYIAYKERIEDYLLEQKRKLIAEGYTSSYDRYMLAVENGKVRREIYESFKNINR